MSQQEQLGLHRRLLPECAPPSLRPSLACMYTLTQSAVFHSRHVCRVTQQTCWLCPQQTPLRCGTAHMSALSHSRNLCCATQQICLLCDIADMSAVSHSRHAWCVTQWKCLLFDTADMSAVSCELLGSCGSHATGQLGSPFGAWLSLLNHELMSHCHVYIYIYIVCVM